LPGNLNLRSLFRNFSFGTVSTFFLLVKPALYALWFYILDTGGYPLAGKSSSAEKRHRQSEERRLRNKAAKSSVRTSVKKFVALTKKKEAGADAEAALKDMIRKLDSAARKGIIKKNAASRKKSRMQRFFNTLKAQSQAASEAVQ
jgi:small subunit ribosomal protein S20